MTLQEICQQLRKQALERYIKWTAIYEMLGWEWRSYGEDRLPTTADVANHCASLIAECQKDIYDHEIAYAHVDSCGIEVRIDLERPDESYIAFTDKHHVEIKQGEG